ncbi:hypothetical protein GCM10020331_080880 [Ectobacillus funiculus]
MTRLISEMKEAAEAAIREDDTFIENVLRALSSILTFRKDHKLAWKLFQEDRDIGTPAVQEVLLKKWTELSFRLSGTILSWLFKREKSVSVIQRLQHL